MAIEGCLSKILIRFLDIKLSNCLVDQIDAFQKFLQNRFSTFVQPYEPTINPLQALATDERPSHTGSPLGTEHVLVQVEK
mmetsp:Transcript_38335/g.59838  ORF Transcript_38335/g.59838 Transcript_38335/m.59838 type:complete len:80 (+) Transcript_38335:273-512(+)